MDTNFAQNVTMPMSSSGSTGLAVITQKILQENSGDSDNRVIDDKRVEQATSAQSVEKLTGRDKETSQSADASKSTRFGSMIDIRV